MATTKTALAAMTSTSVSVGAAARKAWDVTAFDGGLVWLKVTNGGTGPTTAPRLRLYTARKQASMPAEAAPGAGDNDWKLLYETGGSTTASAESWLRYRFGPETPYLMVEVSGHAGSAVAVEAGGNAFA